MRRKWSTVRVESPEALAQALDSIREEWPLFWFACDQAETFGIFLLQGSATGAGTLFFTPAAEALGRHYSAESCYPPRHRRLTFVAGAPRCRRSYGFKAPM